MRHYIDKHPRTVEGSEIDVPDGFVLPSKTQWAFTPTLQTRVTENGLSGNILTGTNLSPDISLHHDSESGGFSVSIPDDYGTGLKIEFTGFSGSFFSLAFEISADAAKNISKQDLLRVALRSQSDQQIQAYIRLNICHGPNTEQVVRTVELGGESYAEFDIFYIDLEDSPTKSAWIDLIINEPSQKSVVIDEVVILRRVRASL